ncbi:hypothetical protein DPMN_004321 [Dreissena polymorpha]|uniref:Uncharacterized protein n=1 Tax=Dreissena polymorpha TaxID=45954 RepID=A0A9D4MSG2_DREPO|nr:hypothetical protein DPMN_004321 [Dreissena polymorpha]
MPLALQDERCRNIHLPGADFYSLLRAGEWICRSLLCQEPLTAPHMLLHCPNHKAQRDHLEAALHSHGLVFNLTNVLDPKGAARGPVFSALAKYLLDCQITDKI